MTDTQGETFEQLTKAALSNPSEDVARLIMTESGANSQPNPMAEILKGLGVSDDLIQKTITTGTGLVAYDLQAPAKNLYPVATPIRNRLPRVGGGTGKATNWVQVNAIVGSGFDAMGWVPEGQRSGQMSYSTTPKAANYATLGEEDAASFEAVSAGRGFEDVQARMSMRLLQKMMLKEEFALMGGNNSLALGTPATATLSASGSGATLPALTYSVIVVALTLEGYANSVKLAGALSVPTSKSITGADGKTFTLNGGSSNKSASATQAVTLGQTLFASVAAVTGAVGYAWFVGATGSETLQAITNINSTTFSAPLTGGAQAATTVTADSSSNATAFDGLLTAGFKPSNGAQVIVMPTGTAGVGSVLTASGKGSVNEIDTLLLNMWNAYQVSPSVIYVNAQEMKNITTKCLQGSSGPLLQYFQDPKAGEYALAAGGYIEFYFNPFMLQGGMKIPIKIHPNLPAGTILAWAENLPLQYQSNEVPNVAEVKTRVDYYQIDWPIVTRQRQVGVYAEEVLAIYAPFAIGIITNIANG